MLPIKIKKRELDSILAWMVKTKRILISVYVANFDPEIPSPQDRGIKAAFDGRFLPAQMSDHILRQNDDEAHILSVIANMILNYHKS